MYTLVLLDLDGTLLRTDRSISDYSVDVINQCKEKGLVIGISTARGASNARPYIARIAPQVVISSGGALVEYQGEIVYTSMFSAQETRTIVDTAMRLTDGRCEITVDTLTGHYWNYQNDPHELAPDWGEVIHTDYRDFQEPALKISVELDDEVTAGKIAACVPDCDLARFSGGNWYKLTRTSATKAHAIGRLAERLGISADEMIAFGDDYVDIDMLRICGKGVAMGNAIDEVKRIADDIAASNDDDGVAKYLAMHCLGG